MAAALLLFMLVLSYSCHPQLEVLALATSSGHDATVRGRVLGGSSMINIGFYSRADKEFYKESGIAWDMDMVDKAYQCVEETVVFQSNLSAFQSIFGDALLEAGVGPDNGFNLNHASQNQRENFSLPHDKQIRWLSKSTIVRKRKLTLPKELLTPPWLWLFSLALLNQLISEGLQRLGGEEVPLSTSSEAKSLMGALSY